MCKRASCVVYNVLHSATGGVLAVLGSKQDEQTRKRAIVNVARVDQRRRQKAWLREGRCAGALLVGTGSPASSVSVLCCYAYNPRVRSSQA